MTSSSPPIAQNRPASVMSIPTSTVVRKATSPPSSPKPLSMYWMKAARNWSMTPRLFTWDRFRLGGVPRGPGDQPRGRRRPCSAGAELVIPSVPGAVGLARPEEPPGRRARLRFRLHPARPLDRLAAIFRGHHLLELKLLLGAEREQLVGGLLRLETSGRAFAPLRQRAQQLGVLLEA